MLSEKKQTTCPNRNTSVRPSEGHFSLPLETYRAATLKHCQRDGWLIEYYAMNPANEQLTRLRVKLNRQRKRYTRLADFKAQALEMVAQINNKLRGGWSPYYQEENVRLYTKLPEVCRLYLAEKERELRPATLRCYRSFCNILLRWADGHAPGVFCSMFNRVLAVRFLDWCYMERNNTARNYNNMLKMGRALFAWAIERCFCKENPFAGVKAKRVEEKRRVLVPADVRGRISEDLREHNPAFLSVCRLVMCSLMRPKEVRMVRVRDVNLERMCIEVSSDVAKNHHTRYAPLTPDVVDDLRRLELHRYPGDWFLFGQGWRPNSKMMADSIMRKEWEKVRRRVGFPAEMQLYSLRDTGINGMLKAGLDPLTVMQAADHHDLAMTTRYANHRDDQLIGRVAEKAPKF